MKKVLMLIFLSFQLSSYAFHIKPVLRHFFKTERGRVHMLSACVVYVGVFGSRAGTELFDRGSKDRSVMLLRPFEKLLNTFLDD